MEHRCVANRNPEDLLPWLKLNRISAVLSLLMLISELNPVGDSSSKFPCREQRPKQEEHPLSWGSCLKSRLMLYSAGIHSGVPVDSGSPPLQAHSLISSNQRGGHLVSQLWDEGRVLLWSSGTVPQPRRLSCCVSWGRGNIRHRCDVLSGFGCDTVMSQSAPAWR